MFFRIVIFQKMKFNAIYIRPNQFNFINKVALTTIFHPPIVTTNRKIYKY